jgi:hypothetical protein
VSKDKIVVSGIIFITISFFLSFYISSAYVSIIANRFARSGYINDYSSTEAIRGELFFFLAFSSVAFYWNLTTLKKIGRLTVARMGLQMLIDQAAVPISIYIMVLYNNEKSGAHGFASLLNPLMLGIVLLLKHVIILALRKKD